VVVAVKQFARLLFIWSSESKLLNRLNIATAAYFPFIESIDLKTSLSLSYLVRLQ
jgi:hypothetical protein